MIKKLLFFLLLMITTFVFLASIRLVQTTYANSHCFHNDSLCINDSDCCSGYCKPEPDSGRCKTRPPSCTAPTEPTPTAPTNGSLITDSIITFTWSGPTSWGINCNPPTSNKFRIKMDTNPSPTTVLTPSPYLSSSTTSYSINRSTLTSGATYYWKICASNNGFTTEICSSTTFSFQTPPTPTVSLNTSASTVPQGQTFTLNWAATDTNTTNPCTASASPANSDWTGTKPLSPAGLGTTGTGSQTITLSNTAAIGTHTFSLSCNGPGGTGSAAININVTDGTAPAVTFIQPTNNSELGGVVTIEVRATDNLGVSRIEILQGGLGGTLVAGQNYTSVSPATFRFDDPGWDTTALIDASSYTLTATARDGAGNTGSASIDVRVFNGRTSCKDLGRPRHTALISTPQLSGKFAGSTGACVIGSAAAPLPQAAVANFKIPSYAELKSLYYDQSKIPACSGAGPCREPNPITALPNPIPQDTLYLTAGDLSVDTVPSYSPGGGGTALFFVNGSLNINKDIIRTNGALMFIVKDNIHINQNVGRIDALLMAGGEICTNTQSATCLPADDVLETKKPLTVNGGLISLTASKPIQFRRNLTLVDTAGNRNPAEVINFSAKYPVLFSKLFSQTLTITTEDTNYAINQ